MSDTKETPEDAITAEEMAGTAIPARTAAQDTNPPQSRNAFTELMSSTRTAPSHTHCTVPPIPKSQPKRILFTGRDGLGAYTEAPSSFPTDRVIYHTDKWVVINDLYPKSSIHILLLSRDKTKNLLHPFDAFEDPVFLCEVQAEVTKLRILVAKELRRKFGRFSAQDRVREEAMNADPPPDTLPPGRNWEKDVISGVHAHPSMNHLHVHILSVDRVSECMRHRKHYNSFNTPFLVPVEDFPLERNDKGRYPGRGWYLDADLTCWRCGRNFGNKFARLKEHLEEEFEVWKRE